MLMELLKSGCSIQDALELLPVDTRYLHEGLQQGKELSALLAEGKSTSWLRHFQFLARIITIPEAMEAALRLASFEEALRHRFLKQSAYPLLIVALAFLMLQLFSNAIIPQMLISFPLEEDAAFLYHLLNLLQCCSNLFLLALTICIIAGIYLFHHDALRSVLLYRMSRYLPWIRNYCSYQFAGYLKELEACGITTFDALLFLQEVPLRWLRDLASRIQTALENGEEFLTILQTEDLFCAALIRCLQLRIMTQESQQPLAIFLKQQDQYWQRQLKKSGYIIQGTAYAFVAILVLLVFQILLLPLQMLETM